LVSYMYRDLAEHRKWITEEEYKEGLTLAQLAPGPLAAQLSIYLGFVHYRYRGAAVAGLAFVLPSFIMVVLLGMAYRLFGGMAWMRAVFYGVGAAVTGIIAVSCYKLTIKSISKPKLAEMRIQWMLWVAYLIGLIITVITRGEPLWWLVGAGLVYMFIKAPLLEKIGWFFFKAGAFVFGSGLAIVPFLHGGVVDGYHWLSEAEFLDAVAVAMITPGPVVITAPHFKRIAGDASIKAFVDGITAAVIGSLTGAVVIIALRSVYDWPTGLLAVGSCLALMYTKKLKEPYIILIAATVGCILKMVIH